MKQSIIGSFNCAIEGFIYVLKTQRNMRIHFLAAIFILLLSIYFNFTKLEVMMLSVAVAFVLLSEMINTAVEMTIDLISGTSHPLAHRIKDITAGAVLLASINAIIVGYLLFSRHISLPIESGLLRIKESSWHITFISLILILAVVLMVKAIFNKGTPLRGGMPSGHAALAFSMCTIISILTNNGLIMLLSFIMAVIIARSRLIETIHSLWEVVAGAIVGTLATLLIFQLLR